jgi:hypothetical protein
MPDDTPVVDTLVKMTAASIEHSDLAEREQMMARIAALVAVDAPPIAYRLNMGRTRDVGITVDDVQGVLVAIAPIVGTALVVSAASNLADALGFAIPVLSREEVDEGAFAPVDLLAPSPGPPIDDPPPYGETRT